MVSGKFWTEKEHEIMRPKSYLALALAAALMLALGACSSGGDDAPPPGDTMTDDQAAAEAKALADAQKAAMDAWHAARDALAGIAGKESADPAAYQRAMNALADAKAASDAAAAATTSADAKKYQAAAEAANKIAMAQVAMVVAAYEAPALDTAQMAAKSAAGDAKSAYDAAMAALAGVESIKDDDMASYDMAKAQVDAAKAAYDAAKAASDAAAATSDLAEAKRQQGIAEAELAKANTANTNAMKYAGMVQTAYNTRMENERTAEAKALADAQTAAQSAYDTAKMAYDTAVSRVADLEAKKADNVEDYVRAMDALARAKTALDTAMAANDKAQAATTSADAEMYQQQAETAAGNVTTQVAGANMYAGNVETAYEAAERVRQAAIEEAKALADAKKAAMDAATMARTAATSAREAADKVAAVLPGSQLAMDADAAATAAEMAATAAEDASMRASEDTTSADAMAEQQTAEGKQSEAEMKLADAQEYARQAGVSEGTINQVHLVLAQEAAKDAKDAAANYAMKAREAAGKARMQATNARNEANRAMAARTDYDNAKKKAEAAEVAATAAENAATAAETASTNAEAEYMKTMASGVSVADAQAARDEARSQRDMAMAENGKAGTGYTTAMQGAADAMKYANRHVISLLEHANAQDLDLGDPEDVDLAASIEKAKGARLMAMATVIGQAGGNDNNISGTAEDTANPTTVTARWPADTPDDPATDDDEFMAGPLAINVDPDGTDPALAFRTKAEEDDPDTTDRVESAPKTATKLSRDLDSFYGYQIEDGGTHAIVFTDKMQGTPAVRQVTAITASEHTNLTVDLNSHTITDLGSKSGTTYSGVTFYAAANVDVTDDAHDSGTAFMGTLTCPDGVTCNIQTNADGDVDAITGYQFSGSRAARAAVAAAVAAENDDYLAFGVWLREAVTGDSPVALAIAAFAGGGEVIDSTNASANLPNSLTGTATYTGKATGVYTEGDGVDYFEGDAELTANFGAIDTDAEEGSDPPADTTPGTIKGMIDNIDVGGVRTSDEIRLSSSTAIAAGAFSGSARMGEGMIQDDDSVKYPYNGSWSGSFYGGNPDDTTTANVNELAAPDAVAGTFGVTGTMGEGDAAITRSYVGAFGARR